MSDQGIKIQKPIVMLKEVKFVHRGRGKRFAMDIGDFSVLPRERVFLHGSSGAGKSTLLGLLAGIHKPQSGQIEIAEQKLGSMSGGARDRFRAAHLGIVFQQFNLIPYLSVLDNVLLGHRFSRQALTRSRASEVATELLERLGFTENYHDQPASQLSVGQQQRVAVARALLSSPGVVLADEPTSALDQDLKNSFMSMLMELCEEKGTTLVFVSHDHQLRPYFSRAVALSDVVRTHWVSG